MLGSFLSEMPDRLPLSSLALPGTHDTMAFHGWPISQCQSPASPLSTQLLGGIRVLDIRLAVIPPPTPILKPDIKYELIAYHGLWPQKTPFTIILKDIHAFLNSPIGMKETIVMSIKQEDFVVTPARIFSKLVRETIVHGAGGWGDSESTGHGVNKGMWFLENRIPRLGEVRGKVVMLSRFGGDGHGWEGGLEGLGIHPTTWPDSEKKGFQWELKGTLVRTHDWYGIPSFLSIPEKVKLGTENLIPPPDLKKPLLPITYFSAASFPLAFPPTVAKGFGWPKWGLGVEGVNSKLGAWLLDQLGGDAGAAYPKATNKDILLEKRPQGEQQAEPRIRGWTFLDYYSEPEGGDLVPLLIECNFRGRKEGEEGW
uniref:Phosphatidylinositol-specific phospholipase C X domain-containing protein n=1 Tax=Psilocybe cubensis TaxID=181762 RepID=A0A8H7Y5F9_PSICU